MKSHPAGARAVLFEVESIDEVHSLWASLRDRRPEGVEEIVVGARTLLIRLTDEADPAFLSSLVSDWQRAGPGAPPRRTVTLPVVYDGPDLDAVAELTGVAPADVARLHSDQTYTVGFLGFSPGFAYLFGGDPRLAVPRLDAPRTSVPAGSVALAADMTAVYPQPTPGGWRLIGRTDAAMFDPQRAEPALLAPGDLVRFRPVDDVAVPDVASLRSPARPVGAGAAALEVIDPGALLTVQDLGRRGWAHAGVPVAGAADLASARRAGRLVGNPAGSAVLESTLGGLRLRLLADRAVAVTGAEVDVTVDGLPARRDTALPLRTGAEIVVGPCRQGIRVYIAVAGGVDVEPVLGSRSTDTLSGLGPAPLRQGDVLPVGSRPEGGTALPPAPAPTALPRPDSVLVVAGRLGPRSEWLSGPGRDTLATAEFTVGASSDRTGVRLEGPAVELARLGQIPSEGMVAGAVQVPPAGRPIVLMRNHPPTGGYPAVAVADDASVDALAQAGPGQRVRFALRP